MRLCRGIILLLLLAGCADNSLPGVTTNQCPAYSNAFLSAWFPYAKGHVVYFSTQGGGRDTVAIDDVYNTQAYSIKVQPGDKDIDACNAEGIINTKKGSKTGAGLYIQHYEGSPNGDNSGALRFKDYYFSFKTAGNTISAIVQMTTNEQQYILESSPSLQLDGKTYTDVLTITTVHPPTAQSQGIDKLYIARSQGIIGYNTYPDHKEYRVE